MGVSPPVGVNLACSRQRTSGRTIGRGCCRSRWRVRQGSSADRYPRTPFVRAHVPGVPREEPVVPFKIFHSVLPFAVFSLVQILHDLGSCRPRSFKVRVNAFDEDREALSLVADLRGAGAPWPRAIEHDPGVAEMHLRAVDPAA